MLRHLLLVLVLTATLPVSGTAQCPHRVTEAGYSTSVLESMNRLFRVGTRLNGRLDSDDTLGEDGAYLDEFALLVCREALVTITMQSSGLDAMLLLGRDWSTPSIDLITFNDDYGRGTDARIEMTLRPGVYTIIATSYYAGRGNYTLTVRE